MAAVKPKRHGPAMDMTAMCDVAFLLLTFFIMTTQFKSQESVTITTPSSVSQSLIEESNIGTISIDGNGKYYFGIVDPMERRGFITELDKKFNLGLNNDEQNTFTKLAEVGVSQKKLKSYLGLTEAQRSKVTIEGIPCDSTDTELVQWLETYRVSNPAGTLAIRGDVKTGYPFIKVLFDELGKVKFNKFKLITKGEK